jgi:hypothetical protein
MSMQNDFCEKRVRVCTALDRHRRASAPGPALRELVRDNISPVTGFGVLFAAGYAFARYSGLRPFIPALVDTGIGAFLVALQ